MRQLLQSIRGINRAQTDGTRHFESHIFFDGAVKDVNPTDSVLMLVSLAEEELGQIVVKKSGLTVSFILGKSLFYEARIKLLYTHQRVPAFHS
ncbi:hypothetical protein DPMN_031415 [Dreissena polymorpha]|uniref:Uncharacterized protein n=1 Tax=Dreissena polymorpha TaxID=45954 RepID=A0A9D4RI13_DREPO|nr:hypothetical protein DPMN_031415 [Dreissena polymorpha]